MKLFIPKDIFDNPRPPRVFLATTGKKIIGQLPAYETSLNAKWNSYAEFSFSIDNKYTDILTGQTIYHPLFEKTEGLRKVYVENIGYFVIQDSDSTYGEKDTKSISCFSSEYETANKYLENFYVNTGEINSKEVIALESIYGYNYTIDQNNLYKQSTGKFDPYEQYYSKQYTDNDSYVYEPKSIFDEEDYMTYDGTTVEKTLYVKAYPNVRFYWPTRPELSLLHLIFTKIPEWKIGDVDQTLWYKERTFDQNRIAVYDFLMNDVSETFNCVIEWNTITNTVNFYEEAEDGINDDNTIQTRWDTDVFISRDNLANEININYSTDDIKTKLKVFGSDDLNIRDVNLGKNYIMNLDYYHTPDWMEQDLFERYDDYCEMIKEYDVQYADAVKGWVAANNQYLNLMYTVPAECNVVLVNDPFEKLYCVYTPINTAYSSTTILDTTSEIDTLYSHYDKITGQYSDKIDKNTLSNGDQFTVQGYLFAYDEANNNFKYIDNMTEINLSGKKGLINKLTLYHVNKDIKANNSDNCLLRLTNANSDTATIRIYNASEAETDNEKERNPDYKIQVVIVYAQSGITSAAKTYTMEEWIQGLLTAEYMGLKNYNVQYIGTMGAYFVLAKDERQEATLEEYSISLLQNKHKEYTTIFKTQTEEMFSQEKYQCIVQKIEPEGVFEVGTKWLDTDSSPVVLKEYNGQEWISISADISEVDQMHYENYQRYIDNYEKMVAVQNVLVAKEKEANYTRDGYKVENRKINFALYKKDNKGILRYDGQTLEGDMHRAAELHFQGHIVQADANKPFNQDIPIYYFTTSCYPNKSFAVYLQGMIPYVSYATSQGVYQAIMDRIANKTDFEDFFTKDQWIRLSPFIKEDEFSDSNFLLNGYESEERRIEICKELMDAANKELKKMCQPSLEFSMDMANILALPEFKSLINQFQLGNFVRVYIRDGYIKRARLLEVSLNFDDLSDFNCSFGNLVTTKSEIDKHADLLAQAVTAGKQVAASEGDWQNAVDKTSKLETEIANGLQNTSIQVGRASGQAISWDEYGFRCRKLVDGTTDQYLDEQIAIINNKIVFTNDGWKTSKAALGEFEVDVNGDGVNEKMYGLLADAVVSGYVKGSVIEGGSLKIGGTGGTFIVHEDGSVQILAADAKTPIYATQSDVDLINNARQYHVELSYDGSTIFGKPGQTCILTCKVYKWDDDITRKLPSDTTFSWLRNGVVYKTTYTPTLIITNGDIDKNAIFTCSVTFDETQIK